jgi:hypothetical protein
MEITAIPVPRLKLSAQSRIGARLPDFITLMKPRVRRLFVFSILYLFALFAALLLNNIGDRWSSTLLSHAVSDFTSCSQAETPAEPGGNLCNPISLNVDEI